MILPTDENGHAILWLSDDDVIEAGADDPHYGDPSGWPWWCDERWELTEPATPRRMAFGAWAIDDDDFDLDGRPWSRFEPATDETFEPDLDDIADFLERLSYELECGGRFA